VSVSLHTLDVRLSAYTGCVSVNSYALDVCLAVNIHWMCVCQFTHTRCVSVSSHTLDVCLSVHIPWMCVCQLTYTGCVSVSSHNILWHLDSDLFSQHMLMVCLSFGQLFVFVIILYKSWNITQIYIFKIKYILTAAELLENCNFLLMMILLTSLATKNLKNLFCNIVVKHLMLKKFGLERYDAGRLGDRLHCYRGT